MVFSYVMLKYFVLLCLFVVVVVVVVGDNFENSKNLPDGYSPSVQIKQGLLNTVLTRTSFTRYIFCDPLQERLDFSCAMFGPDGGLVANAPHIPVHLGSMQETVQYQVRKNYVY